MSRVTVDISDLDLVLQHVESRASFPKHVWGAYRRLIAAVENPSQEGGTWQCIVTEINSNCKLPVIKAVREALGVSLKEAKDFVDLPLPINLTSDTLPFRIPPELMEHFVKAISNAGAYVREGKFSP